MCSVMAAGDRLGVQWGQWGGWARWASRHLHWVLVPAQGYQGGWSGCGRCKGGPPVSSHCPESAAVRLWREEAAEALGWRRHRGTLFPSAAHKQLSKKQRGEG